MLPMGDRMVGTPELAFALLQSARKRMGSVTASEGRHLHPEASLGPGQGQLCFVRKVPPCVRRWSINQSVH